MSKYRLRKFLWLAVALVLVMVLAVGCRAEEEAVEPDDPEDPVEEPEDPVDEPKVFRIGMQTTLDILDPHRTVSESAGQPMHFMYDTLVVTDFDLATVKPHLATDWEVSEDGLVYTFNIRDDVKFHSGRPMTAEDVVWSFERWFCEEINSPSADRAGRVKEVRLIDDYTMEIEMEAPHAMLLIFLAQFEASILDREMVEEYGDDFGSAMTGGTGPYKFVEWIHRERIVMEKNPDYTWGPPIFDNQGPAHLDRIEYIKIPEPATLAMELEAGDIDIVWRVPVDHVAAFQDNPNLTTNRVEPFPYMRYIGFKIVRPFADDIIIRTALNHAVDKVAIADAVYYGVDTPIWNIMPPGVPDYWEGAEDLWPKYDPDRGNEILDEAGYMPGDEGYRYKDGERIELEFIHFDSAPTPEMAMYVQSFAREVGIHIESVPHPTASFWPVSREDTYEMFHMNTPVVSTLETAGRYFHTRGMPAPNRVSWSDDYTDEIIDKGRAARTMDEAYPYAKELQRIVAENVLWIPLLQQNAHFSHRHWVEGVKAHGQYGVTLAFGQMDIDLLPR